MCQDLSRRGTIQQIKYIFMGLFGCQFAGNCKWATEVDYVRNCLRDVMGVA
jgi:hypothetical protein